MMRPARCLAVAACLLAMGPGPGAPVGLPVPEVCFAPGTSQDVVRRAYQRMAALQPARDLQLFQFQVGNRWSSTATNPGPLGQGDPTTIRWSVVPDGTFIPGSNGEPASASSLIVHFNSIYGSPAAWLALLQQSFDRWGQLTGNTYVFEPNDDGASFPDSPGVIGLRGDVRIAGHPIDGNFGILAYNFFPDFGDMVIDVPDSFYLNTASDSLRLRNTIGHEHGHGLGFSHVCPISQTKLMEPFLTVAFDGPQHDDILAGQRGYGDDEETNDTLGVATDLGSLGNGSVAVNGVSADDNSDVDRYKFTVAAGKKVNATVTPVGFSYLEGPQMGGMCSAGTSFNSLTLNDLGFQLIGTDGTTVLATVNAQPAGVAEALSDFVLGAAGTYSLRVFAGGNNQVQLYDLGVTIADAPPPGAMVSAAKTVSGTFEVGGAISYSVVLTNGGTLAQGNNPGDEFTDTLPATLSGVSANATSGTATTAGNTVTWNGSIAVSGSVTITINATITAGTEGAVISNQGTVGYDADGNGTNEASALTDDPGQPSASDPTVLFVGSGAVDFFTLPPCRILDTRNPAGPLGGPALAAQDDRPFTVTGTCGIPATAKAISVNLAVAQPTAAGNLRLRPAGVPVPLISSINYVAGQTRSNNAVVPLSGAGQIAVFCAQASGTVHFILDVNGYFE